MSNEKYPNAGKPWSAEDDRRLLAAHKSRYTEDYRTRRRFDLNFDHWAEMTFGRSPGAVRTRLNYIRDSYRSQFERHDYRANDYVTRTHLEHAWQAAKEHVRLDFVRAYVTEEMVTRARQRGRQQILEGEVILPRGLLTAG
jgi:hypothetical protein